MSRRFEGPEEVVALIRELAQELGRAPRLVEVGQRGLSVRVVRRFFPDWHAAVEAAGYQPRSQMRAWWTHERAVAALRKYAARLGRPLAPCDVCAAVDGLPSPATLAILFGSLGRALEEAGVAAADPDPGKFVSDLEVFLLEQVSFLPGDARFFTREEVGRFAREFALTRGLKGQERRLAAAAQKVLAGAGVAVLAGKTFSLFYVRTVCDWLRGRSVDGVCPSREELAAAMGDKAFQTLRLVVRAGGLSRAAREAGVSPWALSLRLRPGARRAAQRLLPRPLPSDLLVARRNRYGVPLILVERTSRGKTIDGLARAAGVPPAFVRALEEGRPVPSRVAAGIARALRCRSGSLFVRAG
jgi:hypothetical protein